jgi:hypothetical protein
MGFLRKIFKPISKVLDKVVPNELKPLLPYAAAFAPYLLPGTGIFASMAGRGFGSAAANLVGQLAQEGNEGEVNPLSLLLAGAQGAFTAPGDASRGIKSASETFKGGINPGEAVPIPRGDVPGMSGGFKYDASGLGALDKTKNYFLKGGAKLADLAGDAKDILQDPFAEGVTLEQITSAGATPFSQASGDVIYGEAIKQKKDYEREEARRLVEEEMRQRGLDQSYIDSIIASMTAYGYTQAEIDEILAMQGYATGGRVGYNNGGGIMDTIMGMFAQENKDPDFNTMAETVENIEMKPKEYLFDNKLKFEIGPGENEKEGVLNALFGDTEGIISEDRKQEYYNLYINDLYRSGNMSRSDYDGYIEEGILTKPKYNMGGSVLPQGMEMDYRGGGMIPMGSKERADDVPARVSKNEFVMTADAVRGAGGGNVNEGAKRMYNLMNNLEARA